VEVKRTACPGAVTGLTVDGESGIPVAPTVDGALYHHTWVCGRSFIVPAPGGFFFLAESMSGRYGAD